MKKFAFIVLAIFVAGLNFAAAADQPKNMREALSPFIERGQIPGIVAIVATPEKVVSIEALGWADIESQRPMTPDTVFAIASQTKTFTAVCVMICVEEGKMKLDEPVEKYLPELKDVKVKTWSWSKFKNVMVPCETKMTIRQLLSHTAGWPMVLKPQQKDLFSIPLSDLPAAAVKEGIQSQPGEKFNYSNAGIDLAAAALERVTGMKYEEFLKLRVLDPLGMKETTFFPTKEHKERLASCYHWNALKGKLERSWSGTDEGKDNSDEKPHFAEAGGGLISTPNDLIKFYQMLGGNGTYNGTKILSPESVKEISSKQKHVLFNVWYGLGTFIADDNYGHGGLLGSQGYVFNNGYVGIYQVQMLGVPKQSAAEDAFKKMVKRMGEEKPLSANTPLDADKRQ